MVASALTGASGAVRIHARTAGENKTLYDASVNLLRVTTEALSAVIGGCDSLTITPCGFDAHLAANVQRILREESHLDRVLDPGAGSYYIETLTDMVATEAWALFRANRASRWMGGLPGDRRHRRRAGLVTRGQGRRSPAAGACWSAPTTTRTSWSADRPPTGSRARGGGSPNPSRRSADAPSVTPSGRGARPACCSLSAATSRMRKARSAFCFNLFGCAGFEIVTSDALEDADLVVLCSADAEYLALAREVVPQVRVPVVVAGYPKDHLEALTTAGVSGFVHAASNAVDTLTQWQDRMGMGR